PPTPAPVTETCWVLLNASPFRSNVAPLLICTTAEDAPNADTLPALRVPWYAKTVPVNELFVTPIVSVPVPACSRIPAPEITFETVTLSLRLNATVAPEETLTGTTGREPLVPPL